ncbi:hypothetical protein OV203_20370 [Nannocystis sp. ILAH1]|uniref:hypothetical protein n=1 Tax=Nannocystis sp. ILAH1 TaxID=2996789 RepID=UPI00227226CE|nr:hypothetical protein [Nannocystis sp. ILAH1]MCY0989507.1 hypothetical protein [Nannocystis sp. ILAH1]
MKRLILFITVAALALGISAGARAGAPSHSPDRVMPKLSTRVESAARMEVRGHEPGAEVHNVFFRRSQANLQPELVKRASRSDAIFVHAKQLEEAEGDLRALVPSTPQAARGERRVEITPKSVVLHERDGRRQVLARHPSIDRALASLDRATLQQKFSTVVQRLELDPSYPSLLKWSDEEFTLESTAIGTVPLRSGRHTDGRKYRQRLAPPLRLAHRPNGAL